jgi:hypothetical protein
VKASNSKKLHHLLSQAIVQKDVEESCNFVKDYLEKFLLNITKIGIPNPGKVYSYLISKK